MYSTINFKTKKELKAAVLAGKRIEVYQPGGFFPGKTDGTVCIEGPHYPAAHSWYATVVIKDSVIQSVK